MPYTQFLSLSLSLGSHTCIFGQHFVSDVGKHFEPVLHITQTFCRRFFFCPVNFHRSFFLPHLFVEIIIFLGGSEFYLGFENA